MFDKRIIIELIKYIEKIQFTEQIEGDVIGYINDGDKLFKFLSLQIILDNIWSYHTQLKLIMKILRNQYLIYKDGLLMGDTRFAMILSLYIL